jgi:glycolate oxidase iron-sulfur subunit
VGSIVETTRDLIAQFKKEKPWVRFLKGVTLGGIVPYPSRLSLLMDLVRFYQVCGLRNLSNRILKLAYPELAERESLLVKVPPRRSRRALPELSPAEGVRRKRVAFFTGCIAPHLFPEINRATVRVLQRNGYEVVVPRGQRCCGALHLHNGLPATARNLAETNIEVFLSTEAEAIVVNAAGCGAALAEYGKLLDDSAESVRFAERIMDVSVLLVRDGFESPPGLRPARVAYDAPCHLHHAQRVQEEPIELLNRIPGLTLVPFRDPDRCCGSAGVYNITRYRESMKILDEKMRHIREADPDIIATGNPGCLIQLGEGIRRIGLGAEVIHPVVLLDRAYRDS